MIYMMHILFSVYGAKEQDFIWRKNELGILLKRGESICYENRIDRYTLGSECESFD
jgi:hypothetical protein